MKTINEIDRLASKLIVLQQCQLEVMDELKETPLYRQNIKFHVNKLEELLEDFLKRALSQLDDSEKEESFVRLQKGVNKIIDATLEEIFIESSDARA
tara:strand:+ start:2202 stop:2492 length:291 start_codon:yes stop_codon:yes gene_type:complete